MRLAYLIPVLFLAGCGPGTTIGTIASGECQIVHTPQYAVLGKTAYDRNWIVTTEESLVRGCNQPRPLPRPASFDKPKAKIIKAKPVKAKAPVPMPPPAPAVVVPTPESPPIPPPKPVKKHWWQRLKKSTDGQK